MISLARPLIGEEERQAVDAVLRSGTTRGALASLLGPDHIGSPWGGGVLATSVTY